MTQRWQKLIRQLQQKKYRKQEGLFLVEGEKSVLEVLKSDWKIEAIHCTEAFITSNQQWANHPAVQLTDAQTLSKAGSMATNEKALAVVAIPSSPAPPYPKTGFLLALDDVRDPGNLGTIIRIADWYAFKGIICSPTSADCYNPKVIASSMGSFLRIPIHYCELGNYFSQAPKGFPILGAMMEGTNTHLYSFPSKGIVVMGNESNGLSAQTQTYISDAISIPRFGQAESLNVGIATAIICDSIRRQHNKTV